jgi:hypothetical protein
LQWYNPPEKWRVEEGTLAFEVMPKTDYWRTTHTGYVRDTGHFFFREESGDFVARVKVSGAYRELYDQAGLMVRVDEKTWIKTGIEFVNGKQNVRRRDVGDRSRGLLPPGSEGADRRHGCDPGGEGLPGGLRRLHGHTSQAVGPVHVSAPGWGLAT